MGFCDHCEGQRFDRAQVLRELRAIRKRAGTSRSADRALALAIETVRALEIPHLEIESGVPNREVIH